MQHSTNYTNTFITVADDCPATQGEVPPPKGDGPTVATLQFDMIHAHPYTYTSDEVVFGCHANKKGIAKNQWKAEKELFFSKGQACLRASPLAKRYGWGIHHDAAGKVALYGVETAAYQQWATDKTLTVVKAMKSNR
jgi:hypothetical protein